MHNSNNMDVIIYRVKDKGLEVFLVNNVSPGEAEQWQTISTGTGAQAKLLQSNAIELDPTTDENGKVTHTIAIEADWHDIPSLRALMYEDYRVAKEKAKMKLMYFLPDIENGTYFAVKEAFKKIAPNQYVALKELKDILLEKNQTANI
jgi:predicted NUDIX family NTP pyrophosphohydrolase